MEQQIKQPFLSFFDWINNKIKWISDLVSGVVGTVSSTGDNIGDNVKGAIQNISSGIGDGLISASNFFTIEDKTKIQSTPTIKSEVNQNKSIGNSIASFFCYSNKKEENKDIFKKEKSNNKIGDTLKKIVTTTAISSQLLVAQPNTSHKLPKTKDLLKSMYNNKTITNQMQVAPLIKIEVKDGKLPEDISTQIQTLITKAVNDASSNSSTGISLSDGEF